jgi:hypothetical protein
MQDIDACCKAASVWPDMVLNGHSHLYQRFTRTINGRQVPYICSGSGGYAATAPMQGTPPAGTVVGDHKLEVPPIAEFGYLTLQCDGKTLSSHFKLAPRTGAVTIKDTVSLDLKTGQLTINGVGNSASPTTPAKPVKPPVPAKPVKPKPPAKPVKGTGKKAPIKKTGKSNPPPRTAAPSKPVKPKTPAKPIKGAGKKSAVKQTGKTNPPAAKPAPKKAKKTSAKKP